MRGPMFELSVALKYLIPRWRQLSVSIISSVSILVIALVVWLIVVFFSVKDGLEKSWVDKIIALTAPIRISPTDHYYNSYYYLVDTISNASDYSPKTIGEKLALAPTHKDPYSPETDEEIPAHWPPADRLPNGTLKDLVGEVDRSVKSLPAIKNPQITDFETTIGNIHIRLLRHLETNGHQSQQFLDQVAYLGTFDPGSSTLAKALLPPSTADYNNLLQIQTVLSDNLQEDNPDSFHRVEIPEFRHRLKELFDALSITSLNTPPQGWQLPVTSLPRQGKFDVVVIMDGSDPRKIFLPTASSKIPSILNELHLSSKELNAERATLTLDDGKQKLSNSSSIDSWVPVYLINDTPLKATLLPESIDKAAFPRDLRFSISDTIQGVPFETTTSLQRLRVAKMHPNDAASPLYIAQANPQQGLLLPAPNDSGEPILLPKSYREAGVLVGDQGFISYHSPTASSLQEQRATVFVAGFYDPGIMPIGSKYILTSKDLISTIRGSYIGQENLSGNGLNIRFDNIHNAKAIKKDLEIAFEKAGIAPYWTIQTYQEYEFTKDLIEQLQSEKNLFSVISLVIIIVACSNIISMLIILVNDKKTEIGILRSMGATSLSIAIIFGFCGMVMGAIGSILGIAASLLTLYNLNDLVAFIGRLQGHDLFNPIFYGNTLPTDLSVEALSMVVITTAFISLLAGIVPAVKASAMRPSEILKAE